VRRFWCAKYSAYIHNIMLFLFIPATSPPMSVALCVCDNWQHFYVYSKSLIKTSDNLPTGSAGKKKKTILILSAQVFTEIGWSHYPSRAVVYNNNNNNNKYSTKLYAGIFFNVSFQRSCINVNGKSIFLFDEIMYSWWPRVK